MVSMRLLEIAFRKSGTMKEGGAYAHGDVLPPLSIFLRRLCPRNIADDSTHDTCDKHYGYQYQDEGERHIGRHLFIYGQIPFAGNKSAVRESRILNEQAAFLRRVYLESMVSIPPRSGLHRNTRAFLIIAARREGVKSR
jgi:hypothetical protein